MALAMDFPEQDAVVAEVVVHLEDVGRRGVASHDDLVSVWCEVRRCDEAVLSVLEAPVRLAYSAVAGPRAPRSRWVRRPSERARLRVEVAHLHVAVHRRLMVLLSA